MDYQQSNCANVGSPYSDRTVYYGIYINGRWKRAINVGITNVPSGSNVWTLYAPISRGSSNGEYSLAYVAVQVPPNTPLSTYTLTLWANDGVTQETVPVTLIVATSCSGY